MRGRVLLLAFSLAACKSSPDAPSSATPSASGSATTAYVDGGATLRELAVKSVPLPGATGPVSVDYITYDRSHDRVLVPVGDTASVDVFDVAAGSFTRVDGFKTAERESHGKKRVMGPSAVSPSDAVFYVGDRGTNEVCPVSQATLKPDACVKLASPTDGVAFVASAKEVWVTTHDQSIVVLDAANALKTKTTIKTDGAPEGYAVDNAHGLFYTNLEDKNRTLAIDIKTHHVKSTWSPGCSEAGPRGLAVDPRGFVIVACTDSVRVLDAAGAVASTIDTGAGVDNIEFLVGQNLLYVAAGKVGRLSVLRVDDKGALSLLATATTSDHARNAVVDAKGNAYLVDPDGARLLIVAPPNAP